MGPVTALYVWNSIFSTPAATATALQNSGFNTLILWSVHVADSGDLVFNDTPIVSNGALVQSTAVSAFVSAVNTLKSAGSARTLIFSVGSAPATYNDFQAIQTLIAQQGTGTGSILYRNFQALLAAIPSIDAIDLDVESVYDVTSTVAFCKMLQAIGYKSVTLCPYTDMPFWTAVWAQLNPFVSAVNLQCYAGGAPNDPNAWYGQFGSTPVYPGLSFCGDGANCTACGKTDFLCPNALASRLQHWQSKAVQQHKPFLRGGFLWRYDDVVQYVAQSACPSATLSDFSAAIYNGLTWTGQ